MLTIVSYPFYNKYYEFEIYRRTKRSPVANVYIKEITREGIKHRATLTLYLKSSRLYFRQKIEEKSYFDQDLPFELIQKAKELIESKFLSKEEKESE